MDDEVDPRPWRVIGPHGNVRHWHRPVKRIPARRIWTATRRADRIYHCWTYRRVDLL